MKSKKKFWGKNKKKNRIKKRADLKKKRANLEEKGAFDKKGRSWKREFCARRASWKRSTNERAANLTSERGEERTLARAKKRSVQFLIRKGKVEVKEKEKNFLEIAAPKKNNTFLAHEIKMALLM